MAPRSSSRVSSSPTTTEVSEATRRAAAEVPLTLRQRLTCSHLPVEETLQLGAAVARQLAALHALGVHHGDLHPGCIACEPVSLLDPLPSTEPDSRYLAPEAAGVLPRTGVGAGADLYALGLILTECVQGHPWQQLDSTHWLRAQLGAAPVLPQAPRCLEDICARLLHPAPELRYRCAQAVALDLELLAELLHTGHPDPVFPLGLHDLAGPSREPTFVVREAELRQLQAQASGVTLLRGESGSGKSRLLTELARRPVHPQVFLLQAHPGQRPLDVLEQLTAQVQLSPTAAQRVAHALGPHASQLAALLPSLQAWLQVEPDPDVTPQSAADAVEAWFTALAPCALLIDDLQWADSLLWELLGRMEPVPGLRVVASLRLEGCPSELVGCSVLDLLPLQPAETSRLVAAVLGAAGQHFTDQVQLVARGNVFVATEVARSLGDHDTPRASAQSAALLFTRLEAIPADNLALLGAAAVIGRSFDVDELAVILQQDAARVEADLQPAIDLRILWAGPGNSWLFAHDRLREEAVNRLTPARRAQLHTRAAGYLQAQPDPNLHRLARHVGASEQPEKCFPHALAAARDSAGRFSFQLAEDEARLALRWAPPAQKAEVHRLLSEVLLARGSYAAAAEQLDALLQISPCQPAARAELHTRYAYLELSRGNVQAAIEQGGRALAALNIPVPASAPLAATGHLLGWRLSRSGQQELTPAQLLEHRVLSLYGFVQFFAHRPDRLAWAHLRALRLAARARPSPQLGESYAIHAALCAAFGWFGLAEHYGNESIQLQSLRAGRGRAHLHRAYGRLYSARLEAAAGDYQKALSLLGRSIQVWDHHVIQQNLAHLHVQRGSMAEAARVASELYQRSELHNDPLALASALRYWVRATGGRVPVSLVQLPAPGDRVVELYALETAGVQSFYEGRFPQAVHSLRAACRVSAPPSEMVNTWCWLASACRCAPQGTGRLWSEALRRALKLGRRYPLFLPHAEREWGWWWVRRSRPADARAAFERSLQTAVDHGQRYEEALTRRSLAEVGAVLGWSDAKQQRATAELLFAETGADWEVPPGRTTPAQLDRTRQLLQHGSAMAASLQRPTVLARLQSAACDLLRAENVELLPADSDDPRVGAMIKDTMSRLPPEDQLLAAGLRSALACPVRVHGKLDCVLWATHSRVPRLFDQEEQRVAEFLASLAGTTLEAADSFRERLRMQDALQESEAHFRTLFYEAGPALAVVDRSGVIRDGNATLAEWTGLHAGDLLRAALHPDDADPLATWRPLRTEARYRSGGAAWLWGQLIVTPLDAERALLALSDMSYRKLRQVVRFAETERRLLSSDLHDVVTQPLAGLSLLLQGMERAAPERRAALLQSCSEACVALLAQLANLMHGLRGLSGPLPDALRQLCLQWEHEGRFQLQLTLTVTELPELTAVFLHRILHECLQNVARHARARHVTVQIQGDVEGVQGRVADDGCGCDPETPTQRLGLRGMKERAELLGGWLSVDGSGGTTVTFFLPARQAL